LEVGRCALLVLRILLRRNGCVFGARAAHGERCPVVPRLRVRSAQGERDGTRFAGRSRALRHCSGQAYRRARDERGSI